MFTNQDKIIKKKKILKKSRKIIEKEKKKAAKCLPAVSPRASRSKLKKWLK
jgi:hypothetical protein